MYQFSWRERGVRVETQCFESPATRRNIVGRWLHCAKRCTEREMSYAAFRLTCRQKKGARVEPLTMVREVHGVEERARRQRLQQ